MFGAKNNVKSLGLKWCQSMELKITSKVWELKIMSKYGAKNNVKGWG